ncbi:MAG: tetraacyldisaccharide 4'-kinase [Bacteroidota bacterium]
MNVLLRIILFPFSILYGIIISIRNKLFDWKIFRSRELPVASISVGNLTVGGTGKTPHIEYITELLKSHYTVGIVSRGYRRRTKGFRLADDNSTAMTIGDEPMQYWNRYKEDSVYVAVDENRYRGCKKLLDAKPDVDVILLDDAFQHRWINPGINIILSDFFNPYHKDFMMPSGRLREPRKGAKRADIIIVSKAGKVLSPITRRTLVEEIKPSENQNLHFSYIEYGEPKPIPGLNHTPTWGKTYAILLVTGIANPYPFEAEVSNECSELHKLKYPDHHKFSVRDAEKIKKTFEEIVSVNKIIITTEKDAMRLSTPEIKKVIGHLPIYYWPIHVNLQEEDKLTFNKQILTYVQQNSRNR